MTIRVEVTRLAKSDATNPRKWDSLTTIASSRKSFKADSVIKGQDDFSEFRRSLGTDLIYLHFYLIENKLVMAHKCMTSNWYKPNWAGIMYAKRSSVLAKFSTSRVTDSFRHHCQIKLNDLVAYQSGDIFNVRVMQGNRELAWSEHVYGVKSMQRQVAEYMEEFKVSIDDVSTDKTTSVFGG